VVASVVGVCLRGIRPTPPTYNPKLRQGNRNLALANDLLHRENA